MKTEIERVCEIMETLLAHQPIIDVPYEKINDIAVALVKEGYGDISEYKAEIERLKEAVEKLTEMLNKTNEPKTNVIKIDEAVVERYENQIKQAQIELMRLSLPKSRHLWRKKGNKNNL